jgi:8-oxo-dGTP pyrophosphatase MutT (NUDIX family)
MYKVFINDKALSFCTDAGVLSPADYILPDNIKYSSIASFIQTFPHKHADHFLIINENPLKKIGEFLNSYSVIEAAGGIVRRHSAAGEILMIFRLGKWDLPKGKIDGDESVEAAAIREITEETGISKLHIQRKLQSTFHMYQLNGNWTVKQSYWFEMITDDDSTPIPQKEENIAEAKWVNTKELPNLLADCHSSIAELLKNEILNRNSG